MANYIIILAICCKNWKKSNSQTEFLTPNFYNAGYLIFDVKINMTCPVHCTHTSGTFSVQPAKKIVHAVKKVGY